MVLCVSANIALLVYFWLSLFLTSVQTIASCILFRFGLLHRSCFRLSGSWKGFLSPSAMMDSFVGYSSLGWSFNTLNLLLQGLQAFIFSFEKPVDIWMVFPLYVIMYFSSCNFQYFFAFLLSILTMTCYGGVSFLVLSSWILCASYICMSIYFVSFLLWSWWISALCHWPGFMSYII